MGYFYILYIKEDTNILNPLPKMLLNIFNIPAVVVARKLFPPFPNIATYLTFMLALMYTQTIVKHLYKLCIQKPIFT